MDKLHLVFPIALLAFIVLVFSEWFVCRRAPERVGGELSRDISRRDALIMAAITLAYSVTAFVNLGNTSSPESFCKFDERGEYAQIEFAGEQSVGGVMYFTGLHTGSYYLQYSKDGEIWQDVGALEQGYADLLKWETFTLGEAGFSARYLRLIADAPLWLGELALFDGDGKLIPADKMSWPEGCEPLFDERDTIPAEPGYMNSSYFDEIYHVRTAFEHLEAVEPYEISHPPLGKLLLGLGIQIFGLNPFGWRFMGTLMGCMMLPVLYLFLKRMFGGSAVPAIVTVVMASDFMHFAQTRIATIDSYAVFFILLMYLFMYIYLESDRRGRGWMLPLALSGICFGLGAASKWTCIYAGAGLGLIWLIDRIERLVAAKAMGEGEQYWRETGKNVLFCLGFFVAVPALIYYLSYYPYGEARGMQGLGMYFSRDYMDIVVDNQKYMFSYHSGVDATHPYSSRWWQWMLAARPIL